MPRSGSRLPVLLALVLLVCAAAPASGAQLDRSAHKWDQEYGSGAFEDGQVLPGRLVLRFEPGARPQVSSARTDGSISTGQPAIDVVAQRLGTRSLERLYHELPTARRDSSFPGRDDYFVVNFDPETSSVWEAAQAFAALPGVISVQPDEVFATTATLPNDPNLTNQWWLRNTQLGGADIRAVGAWSFTTGSENVLVCVADSGVDWQHPDLGGTGPDYADGVIAINQIELLGQPGIDDDGNGKFDDVRGWDFVNGLSYSQTWQNPPQDIAIQDPDPMDYGGHGTAVAGCVSALTNNGIGIASSNWNTKILPCRIGWTSNTGQGLIGMSFAAQAFDYARIMGADVFNCSWGNSSFIAPAVNAAVAAGMIIVESAGNGDNEASSYLGTRDDVISVAATTASDGKTSFSTYGVWVDISAPGEAIYTTSYNAGAVGSLQHTYTSTQGTSFSSPIVAGVFALAKSYFPTETRQQLFNRVLAAVDDIDAKNPSFAGKLGSGRVNALKLFYDGSFWPVPGMMPTVLDAMQVAALDDTVAVEGGFVIRGPVQYTQNVTANLLGGWDASYTTRDPIGNPALMQIPIGSGTVLKISNGAGPGLVIDGFEISGGHVTSPSLAPEEGYYGAGITIESASPVLRNIRVTGNQAGDPGQNGFGGGIAIISASPTLENVEVTNNQALSGAGIYIYDSNPVLRDVNVHDNTAWASGGGANAFGAGVYIRQSPPADGNLLISGGTYANNSTPGSGGAIYAIDSNLEIEDVVVTGNTSTKEGAGIAVRNGLIELRRSTLENNTISASQNLVQGGGLYTDLTTVTVDSVQARGNSATFAGGALAVSNPVSFSLLNSTLTENSAGFFGAGLYVGTGTTGMLVHGNTVANNGGGSVGGNGMYINGGDLDFQRNVVAFNHDGSTAPNGINLIAATATFSCNLAYGNVNGNYGGTTDPTGTDGNLEADPLFCDMAGGNYTLDVSSPAATTPCGPMGAQPSDCDNVGTGIGDDTPTTSIPRFALEQNRPNPFNPTTRIAFSIPVPGQVQLRVYDVRGRLVRTLVDRQYEAGEWSVSWDGRDDHGRTVASGTYLYELRADDQRKVRKMGLLK
jgi:subtilisin family serine protease